MPETEELNCINCINKDCGASGENAVTCSNYKEAAVFYKCSNCDWLGTQPHYIKSLRNMPICPLCHSEALRQHPGYDEYDEHREKMRRG